MVKKVWQRDRRTDRQTENTICRAAWSQLKIISVPNVIHYQCNLFIWNWSNEMDIWSALWILMAWCFSTRASVVTMLSTHPCISSCLWVKLFQVPRHSIYHKHSPHLFWSFISKFIYLLTHWGRDIMDAISQKTFSSAFCRTKIFEFRLNFHWSLFLRVQLTIFQHWFR